MEFALSDDQRMLQETITGFLANNATLDDVRKSADGDATVAERIHGGLGELGLPTLLVPEGHGGLGLGLVEAAVLQEALGVAVSPAGFMESALASIGIAAAGDDAQKEELLPAIASGEARYAIALSERSGARDDAGVTAEDGKLTGTSLFVLEPAGTTHILVADKNGALHVLAADADGGEREALGTIDGTRTYTEYRFDGATATKLSAENQSGLAADKMLAAARVLLAADSLGASQHMLDAAVEYSKEREQFGRVIGSFQAVKHLCAEMAAKLEPSRALVWHAAYALDSDDPEGPVMACLAKSHLAEVGQFIARTSTEVHGGMGFTDLLGLHFWFKRIGANRQLLGGPEKTRAEAARLQGWGG